MIMIDTKILKYIDVNFSPLTLHRGSIPYFSKPGYQNHKIIISPGTISIGSSIPLTTAGDNK